MKKLAVSAMLALVAAPAMAHSGHGAGVVSGLIHPVTGADHLLAMLAVGLWSGFALTRRVWAGAVAFLGAMVLGAGLGWAGVEVPLVEALIAASVVILGALTVLARQGRGIAVSLAMIAGFGLVHGQAHAAEGLGAGYLAGFVAATAALHLAGLALARSKMTARAALVLQTGLGAAIAASGLVMLAG